MKNILKKKKTYFKKQRKLDYKLHFLRTKYHKNIKLLILLLLLLINIFFYFYLLNSNSLNVQIMETDNFEDFEKMKRKTKDDFSIKLLNEIRVIKHLFSNKVSSYKSSKSIIHITVSLNNNENYKYILMVSMFSVLSNCNKNKSFIIYHVLCSPDFDELSVEIFKSLVKKFPRNVEMIFYKMGDLFKDQKIVGHSIAVYYRLVTPAFVDSDRIIHLDGDTMTFKDLREMYNLDFKDNYFLGLYDFLSDGVDHLGLHSEIYTNTGVLLYNLEKIRKDNKTIEIYNMANSNEYRLKNEDQTVLNYLLHPKIGRLPSKYAIFNFEDSSDIEVYINNLRTKIPKEEVEEALKDPTIIHSVVCYPKLWNYNSVYQKAVSNCGQRGDCSCRKYFNLWHSFANQTDYYEEISNFTGVKNLYHNGI